MKKEPLPNRYTDVSEYIFNHKTEFENAKQAEEFFTGNVPFMKG